MTRSDCLECVVGGTRLLVPLLNRVGGLAVIDDAVLPSIALAGRPLGPRAACKGLLLRRPPSPEQFALQVDDIGAMRSVSAGALEAAEVPGWVCPPAWLGTALAGDHRVLVLDPAAVAATLFGIRADVVLGDPRA
jgi:hypothetical protein